MGLYRTLEKGVDSIHSASSKFYSYATTNTEKILKTIINTILLVVIFAVFGCFDFLTMTFQFANILQATFWAKVIAKAIAGGICAYNIGINLSWDREVEKDLVLAENSAKYERLIKLKDQKSFEKYVIEVFNRNEKKKAYISQINRKIYLLNKFSSNKAKLLYNADSDDELRKSELEKRKAKSWYCKKRKELEGLKNEEYVEKNLDTLKVRYNYVDPLVFDLEIDGKSSYKGVKVKGNVSGGKIKSTANVLLGMFGFSMFITIIGLDANQQQFESQMVAFWTYVLTCAEDIGIIVWQTLRGILGSKKIISQELTTPFIGRNKVLTDYVEWCVENKIEKFVCRLFISDFIRNKNAVKKLSEPGFFQFFCLRSNSSVCDRILFDFSFEIFYYIV